MTDNFNGDTPHLIRSVEALLALDTQKALVPHGIPGHARTLLEAAAVRLGAAYELEQRMANAKRFDVRDYPPGVPRNYIRDTL